MRLYEYQAKGLVAAGGIPIPEGEVTRTAEEAGAIAARLGGRVAAKAQVLAGGRGKAGGVVLVDTPDEARTVAARLLSQGSAAQVLIERAADVAAELYLGLAPDRAARRMTLIASSEGGIEIEEIARRHPERIHRALIDPGIGLRGYHMVGLASAMGLEQTLWPAFVAIGRALYAVARDHDALLAEINPLAVTTTGELLALDAKIEIDDSAVSRYPDLLAWRGDRDESDPERAAERAAREAGISYVRLDGEIGCMVNGAGLAMATMDVIELYGGRPANFLDVGGGARAEQVQAALGIILADPAVRAVLINIFGGITRCDEVARGIVGAVQSLHPEVPLIVRLVGTNEDEGRRVLAEARVRTAATLVEGAGLAVAAAGRDT
jgi:succinyl-CoA synthetase beta subunit